MEHYFKEDQPIVSMSNNTTKVAWVDETSLVSEQNNASPADYKPATNPFDYLFG